MPLQSNGPRRTDEYRRYFPDWTHRSLRVGEELEADHNSYLAGGYAEEFGYLAQAESSRGVPVLDGESPDEWTVRLVQRSAMHPGYPLRPYPIVLDRERSGRHHAVLRSSSYAASHEDADEVRDHGTFVRVTERSYQREHCRPAHRAAAVITRFLATLVALRWELARPRHKKP